VTPAARWSLGAHLVALHLALAGLALGLARAQIGWIAVAELGIAASALVAVRMVRRLGVSTTRLRVAAQLLEEGDLGSRLAERDVDPQLARVIVAVQRTSERLREQRVALEERAHFLDKVLAASPAGLVSVGFDGEITDVNPAAARLLEKPAAELAGRPLGSVGEPLAARIEALAPGESTIAPLSGGRRARLHRGQFMDRGFPRQFLLIEELTEELRKTERAAYEKVIRMMSHEVNNSMAAAGSLLESCLIYAPQIVPAERGDFENALTVVLSRIQQLASFVNSFAAVVRLPAARKVPTALDALVTRVTILMKAEADRRQVTFRLVIDPSTPAVALDPAQLEQALVNVVKNGLEAIGTGGTIVVRLEPSDRAVLLAVEDSGPGLTPAARANLFSPFFSTKERGQGLGLTLVQEILVQNGCEFSLDSPPGGPTRFSMWIPR
jgi:two-component system nitrogen regulation sensor histidine kinase NtrY